MSYITNPSPPVANQTFTLTWTDNKAHMIAPVYITIYVTWGVSAGTYTQQTNNVINGKQATVSFSVPAHSYGVYVQDSTSYPNQYRAGGNDFTVTTVTTVTTDTTSCFVEGSQILCVVNNEEEYIKIEDLKIGDSVKTYNNSPKKISYLLKKPFKNDKSYSQICKLSNYPNKTKDLFLTGGHSILVDELTEDQKEKTEKVWKGTRKIDDKYLLLTFIDENAEKIDDEQEYNVYHLALENDDENGQYGIYANGILTESMSISYYLNVTNSLVVSDYIL
jgi:hypothetical protein